MLRPPSCPPRRSPPRCCSGWSRCCCRPRPSWLRLWVWFYLKSFAHSKTDFIETASTYGAKSNLKLSRRRLNSQLKSDLTAAAPIILRMRKRRRHLPAAVAGQWRRWPATFTPIFAHCTAFRLFWLLYTRITLLSERSTEKCLSEIIISHDSTQYQSLALHHKYTLEIYDAQFHICIINLCIIFEDHNSTL